MRCLAKSHTSPRGGSSERGRGGLISPAAGSSSFPERRPQCNHYNYHYNSTTTSTTAGSAPDDRGDQQIIQAYKKLYGKLKLETLMLNLMMMHLEERRRDGKRRRRNVMSSE